MDYRKFWLINSLGNRYDFTEDIDIFFNEPQGLGASRRYTSIKVGNSELVTSQEFMLTDIQGELLFMQRTNGQKYEAYLNFIQFIKFKPIEFHYQTPNDLKSYHCDVLFTEADKTETGVDGILRVPLTFHRLTEWFTDEEEVYVFSNDALDEGKYYDLVYDYHYAGTNLSNGVIFNEGTDEVGFVLEVTGTVVNPQFSISQNGETYGICKITGTYDYVMIDSVEKTESMYLEYNGSAITNPDQYQDFSIANGSSYLTWCKFRVGESIFSFTCGNIDSFTGTVTIKFKNSYATV